MYVSDFLQLCKIHYGEVRLYSTTEIDFNWANFELAVEKKITLNSILFNYGISNFYMNRSKMSKNAIKSSTSL